jgi:DNA-binding CsgD family transcriptional regulator
VRLAAHFREAGDVERWCRYGKQAAAIAAGAGDDSLAIGILQSLLDEDRLGVDDRAELAKELGNITLSRRSSSPLHVERVVRTLRSLLDAGGLDLHSEADVRDRLARLLFQQGLIEEGRTEIERAIPNLDHEPVGAAKAMAYLGWPDVGPWPAGVHLDWLERSAKLSRDAMSPVDRLFLAVDRATALLLLGQEVGWDVARDIPETAATAGERLQVARGFLNTGHCALVWGRYFDARRRLDRGLQMARVEGSDRLRGMGSVTLCHLDWLQGAWPGLLERVLALVADAELEPPHQLEARQVAALLRVVCGRVADPVRVLREVLATTARFGPGDLSMAVASALAQELLAEGHSVAALDVTTPCLALIDRKQVWLWAADVAPVHVDALLAAGRPSEARRLARAFGDGLSECEAPSARAALLWCRAAVAEAGGDARRAAGAFGEAAKLLHALPRPYDALRAEERQALALVSSRRQGAGLRLLAGTERGFHDLGAHRDARRTAALQRRIRDGVHGPLAGARPDGVSALSPRELEAVRLVTTGRTDREIADAMFLSTSTVISHLASARRKLGVSTRTALAVAALDGGVVADTSGQGSRQGGPADASDSWVPNS